MGKILDDLEGFLSDMETSLGRFTWYKNIIRSQKTALSTSDHMLKFQIVLLKIMSEI